MTISRVQKHVKRALYDLGLEDSDDLGLEDSDNADMIQRIESRGKKGARLRGYGRESHFGPPDKELCVQWPHKHLGPKYTNFNSSVIKFKNLDSRLFIAGEINIIRSGLITTEEREARLSLLSDTLYNMGHYEWPAILKLHEAILSEIENGTLSWSSDFSRLEQQMLMPFSLRNKKFDKKSDKQYNSSGKPRNDKQYFYEDKILYCKDYQQGRCSHTDDSHSAMFYGKQATVHHICASCLKKNNVKQRHPESSTACPNFEH